MAQTILMVYEDIETLKDKKKYWKNYIEFYELYWDEDATPSSSWGGREYEEFRESLSKHLGLEKKHIHDCFFIKDESGKHFVCPIGSESNLNLFSCENFIPLEWFLLFESNEKNYFYTHTGFGAIHHDAIYYKTTIDKALDRLNKSKKTLSKSLENEKINSHHSLLKLKHVLEGINNLLNWLNGFSFSGFILLNYGEICSFIEQDSMKNEDSVGELSNIIENLKEANFTLADYNFKLLDYKWEDISGKASGETSKFPVQ